MLTFDYAFDYVQYLQSPEWKERAFDAKRRAEFHCMLCGLPRPLQVHHNNYARIGHERAADLIPLCEECHSRHHFALRRTKRQWLIEAGQLSFFKAHVPSGPELD